MRILLLFLGVLFLSSGAFGQKYSFLTYSTEEGLSQSQVNAITQDKNGYLWIGTIGGLSRFNGGEFLTYTKKEGLFSNRIKAVNYIGSTLWLGHDGGISSINGKVVQKFVLTGDDKSRPIDNIITYKGKLLALSNGGGMFMLENGALVPVDLGGDEESGEKADRKRVRIGYVLNDALYLGTKAGVLKTEDLKVFAKQEEFGNHSISDVTSDGTEFIVTSYDSLLIKKNLTTGVVTQSNPSHLTYLHGCYVDSDKNLWVYGKEGILRIENSGDTVYLDERSGLPLNTVNCIFEDAEGHIWMGSEGRGLFRFTGLKFKHYDQSTGFLSDLFMTGFQKANGSLYLGSFDRSIIHKPKNAKAQFVDIGNPNLSVWGSIKDIDGKDWFGTNFNLIAMENGEKVTIYEHATTPGLPGLKMVSFKRIDDHSMYIGGSEGVSLYRNGKFTRLGTLEKEEMGVVRDIEIVNGVMYCVSNHGLFVFRDNDFHAVEGTDMVLQNIEVDHLGRIWIGSEEGFFYMKNNKLEQIDFLNGDPRANTIYFLNYKDRKIYVGTNNGLFVISNLEGEFKIKRYGVGDGIPDLETNLNSSFFDNDGNFWFGTSSGLVCFQVSLNEDRLSKPKLLLKSVSLNYASFDYSLYSKGLSEEGLPIDLELPYNKNNLIFEFDGISLVDHKSLQYQFFLEGLSEEWSPLSSVATVTFTNLPAGEYVLKVRAVDINGRTSDVYEIPLVIRQAFYKTWWFILLCSLLLASLIFLVFRLRINRIRRINENEMLNYKTRLMSLEQKSLNASMNRHFIFNSLNSIQYFINTRDRLSANKYLTNFAQLIRKNLDTATSEDNRITLEEELERIRLYMSLESMRFKDRFDYTIETNGIDLESYVIPAMIMQPFIENSIIHGILPNEEKKGHIKISLTLKEDLLEILIEDNGIGVNQSISRKAVDTGDHRSQGMEITSKRIELMQKFSDRSMELIGPEEIIGEDGLINGTYVLLKIRVENLEE